MPCLYLVQFIGKNLRFQTPQPPPGSHKLAARVNARASVEAGKGRHLPAQNAFPMGKRYT